MAYKSDAHYEHALAEMREDIKGEWRFEGYVIKKGQPYNLLTIEREDGTPVPKNLRGQWTEVELCKNAIRATAGGASIE